MRADRLVALLMLLQRHGRVTAHQVASELEVSLSTARRDLEALSTAGIPVYSEPGRGGGWRMVGEHRTDLSGLTGPEVRALFLAAGSAPGQSPEVKRALHKLGHVVPEPFQQEAEAAATAVFVDEAGIGQTISAEPPYLAACRDVVVDGVQAELAYVDTKNKASTRVIDPLGIALRHGHWYFLADTPKGRRMFRVDRITALTPLPTRAIRPDGFDLKQAWLDATSRPWDGAHVVVTALAREWVVRSIPFMVGIHLGAASSIDDDGWAHIDIHGSDARHMGSRLAGFAESIRVLGPPETLHRLHEVGTHLLATYPPAT